MVSEERKLKVRATSLRYYYNHKDELKAKRKRYYEANKRRYLDSRREYARRYYEANKERIKLRDSKRDPDRERRNEAGRNSYWRHRAERIKRMYGKIDSLGTITGSLMPKSEPLGTSFYQQRKIAKSLHLNMAAEYLTSNRWSERCMDCHKLYTPTGSATKGSSDNRCYNCRIEYRRNYMADLMRERRAEERQ